MKIAYFSPLSPQRSGISDYSEELLPELSKFLDVDIYVAGYRPTSEMINTNYNVFNIEDFNQETYQIYDEVIYHIGNSPYHEEIYYVALKYPGIVVLHDYAIHHLITYLTVGKGNWAGYISEMKYNYGDEGETFAILSSEGKMLPMWATDKTIEYPANKRIIESARGVIVHSKFAENGAKTSKINGIFQYAPLFTLDNAIVTTEEKEQLRSKYNIPSDTVVFASFGFASIQKRIHSVLAAIRDLSQKYSNILYLIVGEEEKGVYEMSRLIKEMKLEQYARYVGFVTLDEFKEYIKLTDIGINLRYPTQGETSASLLRILGYGKPALVSDIGSFSEFPSDIVIKIHSAHETQEQKEIYEALESFLLGRRSVSEMGQRAFQYVKENHMVSNTVEAYLKAINSIHS